MKRRQQTIWCAASAAAALVTAAGPAVAGPAAAGPAGAASGAITWRPVLNAPSMRFFGHLAVVDRDSAWAFGGVTVAGGTVAPTAFRWERGRWQRVAFPAPRGGPVNGVAVASAKDVWAGTGGSPSSPALVMRWNGGRWDVAKRLPRSAFVTDVEAAGPGDVWTFTSTAAGRTSVAWRHTSRGWSKAVLPFNVLQASARSPRDMWAIGFATGTGGFSSRPILAHYDGRTWRTVPLPEPAGPDELHALMGVTADARGVWITDSVNGVRRPVTDSVLLHLDPKGRWHTERLWSKVGRWGEDVPPVPDGKGGLWFLGSTDVNGYESALVHRSSTGSWTRSKISPVAELRTLARLPGTTRLLAAGESARRGAVLTYQPPNRP
ncbi:hypothetical protein [Actinomadura gamaensis]|uniref:Secreted protein n=1 Tax=Actinomadura gamaensis TaxID=1763541 RepID=A0ABV9TZQ6_9ACTN